MRLSDFVTMLRAGGVVACPTETLVGLLADARSFSAVQRVVDVKRRGPEPIALLLPSIDQLGLVAIDVSDAARALMRLYWPGPLTLVLRAAPGLPHAVAPHGTVGVRVPGPSPAADLLRAFASPLTATSCNPSGSPPATTEAEARRYFGAALDGYVPGVAPGGPASTVIDATGPVLRVLRQGVISLAGS